MSEELTNGDMSRDDFTPVADASRRIASYCEGDARENVYRAAKQELAATEAENNRLRAEVEALREALEKAQKPLWFYHPDYIERCLFDPYEVIDDYYDPKPGKHVFEIECARPLPSIWCAVHCLTDAERDAMDTDERFSMTEHASEEEARAALTRKAPQ